jgi:hypothetical protein
MLNERQNYFGQTVNIAARVQSLSTSLCGLGVRVGRHRLAPKALAAQSFPSGRLTWETIIAGKKCKASLS